MKKRIFELLEEHSFVKNLFALVITTLLMDLGFTMLKIVFCWRSDISATAIGNVANDYASGFVLMGSLVCVSITLLMALFKYQSFSTFFDERTILELRIGLVATILLALFLSMTTFCRLAFGAGIFDEGQFIRGTEVCFCLIHLAFGMMHCGYLAGGLSYLNDLISVAEKAEEKSEVGV